MEKYNPQKIEAKWQKIWEEKEAHRAKEDKNRLRRMQFYCLDMFPYASGEGLHVGHLRGYVLSDLISRYQKLQGKNILHPMGYDAFGLPAENAAIKENSHPKVFTDKAIKRFRRQLEQVGAMYDWSREISSADPAYYKWTQWLFLKLYEAGLAYRQKAPVNWCPSCQTVLANEQVIGGLCERCDSQVVKKELTQWFFKITKYAERLLKNLDKLDWPERTKTLQRNWIGKSEGALIKFQIQKSKLQIEVFTTRPDTLFGATFMVLAPEHELVKKITTPEHKKEVEKYLEKTRQESEIFREKIDREKTGVFTGAYAINPANSEKIPIWVSDYVLLSYGTGACMSVPAHDRRDFEFAKIFRLPMVQVISPNGKESPDKLPYVEEGTMINSEKYDGMDSCEAKKRIICDLEKTGFAKADVNYRLRDWLISRQRYWGAPIPIIYCDRCGPVPVPEKDLPVLLPEDVKFKPTGESPLKLSKTFVNTLCPKCDGRARRETDTLDTFVDSSWYYLRFTDPQNKKEFAAKEKINFWLPVDLYIGGIEHATMHLLYARFVSMALHDLKIVDFDPGGEPFKKLFNIGLIYLHGAKMSKSKGNIVSPDELVKKYGTDSLRGYEMFVGPVDQDAEWQISGITGIWRFLDKVYKKISNFKFQISNNNQRNKDLVNQTIQKVSEDIENFRINTAVSCLMEFFSKVDDEISKVNISKILVIMSPIFPHLAEELWQKLGSQESIFDQKWPIFTKVKESKTTIVIQINGKMRDTIKVDANAEPKMVEKEAQTIKVKKYLAGKKIQKTIYIPGKVLNFVVK